MSQLVVGLYDRFEDAQAAVRDLIDHGFKREDISLIASDANGEFTHQLDQQGNATGQKSKVGKDAGIGAVVGGLGGLLIGLGALAIPGVGPVIAAGPIAGLLGGGAVGAAAGGLVGALTKSGVPQEQAQYYAEGVRRGGVLVTANTPDDQMQQAVDIMNMHNPVDVDRRVSDWRQNQWQGYDESAQPMSADEIEQDRTRYMQNTEGETTLPVMEEELRVGKRQVNTGGVQVHTYVTEEPVDETVNLRQEHVNVERTPVDRPADPEDLNAFEEGTMDVTERGEEVVADKRAHVTEEVKIHKDVEEHPETVHDTVRRTNVDVNDMSGNMDRSTETTSGYDAFDPIFRNHYDQVYGDNTTYSYDELRPYYQYGYTLASSDQYQGQSWDQVEPTIEQEWQRSYPNRSWNEFKDAIYQGWEAAQSEG